MKPRQLARAAYEGYRAHTGGKSLATGAPIPEWLDLPDAIQDAWVASIVAVRDAISREIRNRIDDVRFRFEELFLQ
jgi:hypothetical protein